MGCCLLYFIAASCARQSASRSNSKSDCCNPGAGALVVVAWPRLRLCIWVLALAWAPAAWTWGLPLPGLVIWVLALAWAPPALIRLWACPCHGLAVRALALAWAPLAALEL